MECNSQITGEEKKNYFKMEIGEIEEIIGGGEVRMGLNGLYDIIKREEKSTKKAEILAVIHRIQKKGTPVYECDSMDEDDFTVPQVDKVEGVEY